MPERASPIYASALLPRSDLLGIRAAFYVEPATTSRLPTAAAAPGRLASLVAVRALSPPPSALDDAGVGVVSPNSTLEAT